MEKLLAVTVIAPDRAGLVRDLSAIVTDADGNIQESRMIALGSEFAVLMLIAGNWAAIGKISEIGRSCATRRSHHHRQGQYTAHGS